VTDEVDIKIAIPYACFGGLTGRWSAGQDDDTAFLDVILYEGEECSIRLKDLERAVVALAVQVSASDDAMPEARAVIIDRMLLVVWHGLAYGVPMRPDKAGLLASRVRIVEKSDI
jgi:hypothetical protein